jgi:hypothetical protein
MPGDQDNVIRNTPPISLEKFQNPRLKFCRCPGVPASGTLAYQEFHDEFFDEEIPKIVAKNFDIHPRFFYLARL